MESDEFPPRTDSPVPGLNLLDLFAPAFGAEVIRIGPPRGGIAACGVRIVADVSPRGDRNGAAEQYRCGSAPVYELRNGREEAQSFVDCGREVWERLKQGVGMGGGGGGGGFPRIEARSEDFPTQAGLRLGMFSEQENHRRE